MNSISVEEQETIINLYPRKIKETADIYSSDPSMIKKLEKLMQKTDGDVVVTKSDDISIQAEVPRNWIKISPPRKVNMSEEQKQKSAARLRAAREARKNDTV